MVTHAPVPEAAQSVLPPGSLGLIPSSVPSGVWPLVPYLGALGPQAVTPVPLWS